MEEVHIRFVGSFYTINTHCATLKEYFEEHTDVKRKDIAEWWKEKSGGDPLAGTAKDYFTYL